MFNFLDIINGTSEATRSLMFSVILLWSMFWKGLALWHTARNKQKIWFVLLLIINTIGILEIFYLAFLKRDKNKVEKEKKKKK